MSDQLRIRQHFLWADITPVITWISALAYKKALPVTDPDKHTEWLPKTEREVQKQAV